MTTATQNLINDHQNILELIDVMEEMARCKSSETDHIEKVILIIKEYADDFHHAKEEDLLFPLMVKNGFSLEQGPIAVMLHDHELGRNYVKEMMLALQSVKDGSPEALNGVYENMLGYAELLRSHISKENNVLFKMADKIISENEQAQLLQKFLKIEEENNGRRKISEFISAINDLKRLYIP